MDIEHPSHILPQPGPCQPVSHAGGRPGDTPARGPQEPAAGGACHARPEPGSTAPRRPAVRAAPVPQNPEARQDTPFPQGSERIMTPYDIDAEPFSPRMTRRKFLGLAGCACVAGVGAQYAALVAPSRIVVNSMVVPVPGLPHSLEGLRVGVMSDFHVGDFVSPEFVSDAVGIMNSLHPDMVVLPGDFFQDTRPRPRPAPTPCRTSSPTWASSPAREPRPPSGPAQERRAPGRAGVDLLVNESRSVAYGAATMRLVAWTRPRGPGRPLPRPAQRARGRDGLRARPRAGLRRLPGPDLGPHAAPADLRAQPRRAGAPALPGRRHPALLAHRYPGACAAWRAPSARCSPRPASASPCPCA
jgi:hypothetical protein